MSFNIVGIYRPPSANDTFYDQLTGILKKCNHNKELLLMGDSDSEKKKIACITDKYNLDQIVKGETKISKISSTQLDLIFTSKTERITKSYNLITDLSDHNLTLTVIYVMRNPKDVFTSSFHYHGMTSFLVKPGPQSEFLRKFLDGQGWSHCHIYSIQCLSIIQCSIISQFLEKSLDVEVIDKIAERCVFKNMKQNNMSNYSAAPREFMDLTKSEFLRKGIAGDWKNLLTASESEHFDVVYKDKMKNVKYKFVWD
uniref:Sulfotransferase n=1 Tax=Acanthochromis polyacanthus TaxID=80966 RepID=A0A3Q1GEX1_9TELE